jgi:Flp pilus assembly protein TadD
VISRSAVLIGLAMTFTTFGAVAQLRPPQQTKAPGPSSRYTTESATAEMAGDYARALELADRAIKSDAKDPWGYYDRGVALRGLRRTDEAVAAFRDAESHFGADDVWGKSVAIWGQANALSQEGRCPDAASLYERYAVFVEKIDTAAAALARQYGTHCTPRASVK